MPTLQKRAPSVKVFLDGQEQTNVHPLTVSLGSGATSLPEATLEVETIARAPGRAELLNLQLADMRQPEVEILVRDGNREQVVHWGKALARHVTLNESGDSIRYISRIEDQHSGEPLRKAWFWSGKIGQEIDLDLPTIFNPEDADGVVRNNRSAKTATASKCGLFIDPESTRSLPAREYAGSPQVKAWTLPEAVYYLCTTLNFVQTYINNPTLKELYKIFGDLAEDESLLRHHEQPLGEYLPVQLDTILEPFGFGWTVQFESRGKRSIRIFKRGGGVPLSLKLQPPGSAVDMDKSNLESLALTADVSSGAFNVLTVVGDYKRFESTFELKRAWAAEYDSRSMDDLTKDNEDWQNTPALARVWRDWVLNEAGDYNGLRSDIDEPHDFDSLFGQAQWVARRRKFGPCLTRQHDGSPHGHVFGVYVEYWNAAENSWLPVTEIGSDSAQVVVLDRECGIRFNGHEVPWEIRSQGANAKVRVTATVESDTKIDHQQSSKSSLLIGNRREILNVGKKFKYDLRSSSSRLKTYGVGTFSDSDFSHDDSQVVKPFSGGVLNRWNAATINGTVTITGIDYHSYSLLIGTTISGIDGRKVDFNVAAPGDRRYPTIVGARINFLTQQLDLQLDTFRGDRAL